MVTIYTTVSSFRCLDNVSHFNPSNEKPRIFVAYLPLYFLGEVEGIWVDATETPEEMLSQIKSFLSQWPNSEAESYIIERHQGFYGLNFEFQEDLEYIHQAASFIAKHGELGAKLIAHYEGTLEAAEEVINHRYQGEYKSQLEYATQLFDKLYLSIIPENIHFCIDYESFKTAIFEHYFFSIELKGKTHVFFEYLGDWDFKHSLDDFLKPDKCALSINY